MRTATTRAVLGLVVAVGTMVRAPGAARADSPYALSVEGGLGHYTGALGSAMELGGVWGLRGERFVAPALQLGLAYVGGANQVGVGDELSRPVLQRDGGEVSLKALLVGGSVKPYVEAGAGLARFHLRGTDPSPTLHSATTFTVPVGVGIQANAGVIRMGAGVGGELLLGDKPIEPGGGLRLDAKLHLGARF